MQIQFKPLYSYSTSSPPCKCSVTNLSLSLHVSAIVENFLLLSTRVRTHQTLSITLISLQLFCNNVNQIMHDDDDDDDDEHWHHLHQRQWCIPSHPQKLGREGEGCVPSQRTWYGPSVIFCAWSLSHKCSTTTSHSSSRESSNHLSLQMFSHIFCT